MEDILNFFAELSTGQKLLWVVTCLTFFWILEGIYPLAQLKYKKWRHARLNLVLLGSTIIINGLFGIATAGIFIWLDTSQFGLLNWIHLPLWAELIFAVMLLDFIAQYIVHVLLHKVSFMWRFHMVHHSDTEVDATTGTRHHPGDYIFRELFSLVAIIITGMPFAFYMVYRILTVAFTYWGHGNFRLPQRVDKAISYLFISPNMHKFHHHFERPWTDTNYGNIFSLWDRMFGTFVYDDPQKISYGLDVLNDNRSADISYQLKVPFDRTIKTDY